MILIIRHKNSDKEFKTKLDKNNFNYLYQPVLKFNYLKKKINSSENKIFIIASIHAVKAIRLQKREHLNLMKEANFIVIGKKVNEALIKLGFKKIVKSFDTSLCLLRFINRNKLYKKKKFEYLCGSVVNEEFVTEMKKKKFFLRKKIIYKTEPISRLSSKSQVALGNKNIKVILFYSVYSAKVFFGLMRKYDLLSFLSKEVKYLCFSKRIAIHISKYKLVINQNIRSIKSPDSELLLQSVKKIISSSSRRVKKG